MGGADRHSPCCIAVAAMCGSAVKRQEGRRAFGCARPAQSFRFCNFQAEIRPPGAAVACPLVYMRPAEYDARGFARVAGGLQNQSGAFLVSQDKVNFYA